MVITFILSVLGASLLALHLSLASITLHRIMSGMANGFAFLIALRVAIFWFPNKHALSTGLIIALSMSGGIAGTAIFPAVFETYGLRLGLWINSIVGLFFITLSILSFKDHYDEQLQAHRLLLSNLKDIFKNSINWTCGAYTGFLNLGVYVLASLWGSFYLINKYGFNNNKASEITSLIFLGIIIGAPIWGFFSDKLKNRQNLMIVGALLSAVFVGLITFISSTSLLILTGLFFLLGVSCSAQVLSYPVIAENNKQDCISLATGFSGLIINLIGAVIQPLFGVLLTMNFGLFTLYNGLNITLAMSFLVICFTSAVALIYLNNK